MDKFAHILKNCNHNVTVSSLLLALIGTVGIMSIKFDENSLISREVLIQSASLIIGLFSAAIIVTLDYKYFINLKKQIYVLSIVLLLSVYIPGIGLNMYGSRSWIDLGFTTFQPSEVVKIAFVIIMSAYLSHTGRDLSSAKGIMMAALYGMPFILIVAKEDFGSGCVFCAIWIFMVFCSGLDLKIIGRLALVFTALLPLFYFFMSGYQKERIDAFLSPNNLDLPGNYQVWNSKVAIGSGGFYGKGFTEGTQAKLGFLPVAESDFIFSSIVEEFGFIGGLIIIFLFAWLLFHILKTAKYAVDLQGTLICAGLAGMFFFQAFENIGMSMGLIPVTGITLPFVSSGGSAMISSMMGIGFILSVSYRQKL